ncbi:FlgB family protein [Shimia sp.]|uniref:FlgB family protein n=1 Tax=Shimia sp. TaxID=1954381 RepID=UPI003298093A
MFKSLEIFQVSHALATHAAKRQALVAQNMANADTPGYAARDLQPFQVDAGANNSGRAMRATRDKHFSGAFDGAVSLASTESLQAAPNGNAVSLEEEMMKAVDVKRQHDRALAIYKSSLNILRTSLGRP